jgi:hypothetical protein
VSVVRWNGCLRTVGCSWTDQAEMNVDYGAMGTLLSAEVDRLVGPCPDPGRVDDTDEGQSCVDQRPGEDQRGRLGDDDSMHGLWCRVRCVRRR